MRVFIRSDKIKIGYIISFLLACFLHLYKLADIPYGLHVDEAGMGYDAFCLANYGVDRYLNSFPVYLINFGRGQSALYAYLCAAFVKIWGLNTWTMRMPAAIIGILFYLVGTSILRQRWGEKRALFPAFLMAVMPYFIMQSRFGLDCNLMLGVTTIGLWLLIHAVNQKKIQWYLAAGVVWGISFYTYAISYIFTSLYLLVIGIYLLWCKKSSWKQLFVFYLPVGLLGLPLLAMVIINTFELPQIVLGIVTIPRLPFYAGSEFELNHLWDGFCSAFSCILGNDTLSYNALPGFYTFYGISIPFVLYGICVLIKNGIEQIRKREFSLDAVILIWLIIGILLLSMIRGDGININKSNLIFFAIFYCLILGIETIIENVVNKGYKYSRWILPVFIASYAICAVSFIHYYFLRYPSEVYPQSYFADEYSDILNYIETDTGEPKSVYVTSGGLPYIYYLVSAQISPYEYDMSRENATETYWKFLFYFPDDISPENCIYLVRETDESYISILEEYPFECYSDGMYRLYYTK